MDKNALGLIPQVFYDLIGRVIPGGAILMLGFLLLSSDAQLEAAASALIKLPAAAVGVLFVAFLIAAYLIGLLVGAIGFACFENPWKEPMSSDIPRIPPRSPITKSHLPYLYDFILMRAPAAGARLAKLRAEMHLARVVIIGCSGLAIGYLSIHASAMTTNAGVILAALLVGGLAAVLFQRHLEVRTWRLTVNCWTILTEATPSMVETVTAEGIPAEAARLSAKSAPASPPA